MNILSKLMLLYMSKTKSDILKILIGFICLITAGILIIIWYGWKLFSILLLLGYTINIKASINNNSKKKQSEVNILSSLLNNIETRSKQNGTKHKRTTKNI